MTLIPKNIKLWIQEGPGALHYAWYPGYATTVVMAKQHEFSYEFNLTMVKDNMFIYCYDEHDIFRLGNLIKTAHQNDSEYTQKLITDWQNRIKEMHDLENDIDNIDLTIFLDDELADLFERYTNLYNEEYAIPILGDAIGYYCEVEIKKLLSEQLKKLGREKEFNKILSIIAQPVKDSFITQEKNELLGLTIKFINNENFDSELEKHRKKWQWIQNNYERCIVLDKEFFLARIKDHAKEPLEKIQHKLDNYKIEFQNAVQRKKQLIQELQLNEELKLLITIMEEYGYWQDIRKKVNLIAHHYIGIFLREVSMRKSIPLEDLEQGTYMGDVIAILNSINTDAVKDGKLIKEVLEGRKYVVGMIHTPGSSIIYNHEDSKNLYEEVQLQYEKTNGMDIFGTVANTGKVIATARVISGPKDFDKLNEGEIIITSMTRPEFIPIMKRAAAIVTDEGGISCHAAIISRELDIPCIIGTKIATKTIKDGDLIEVNANHGIVSKIK
jgi:phosphohistidine swiveling domain-containing protein